MAASFFARPFYLSNAGGFLFFILIFHAGTKSAVRSSYLGMTTLFLKRDFAVALAAVIAFCLAGANPAQANNTNTVQVGQGGDVFVPATNNINAGDVIIWHWAGNDHSTTSDTNGIWDSGVQN